MLHFVVFLDGDCIETMGLKHKKQEMKLNHNNEKMLERAYCPKLQLISKNNMTQHYYSIEYKDFLQRAVLLGYDQSMQSHPRDQFMIDPVIDPVMVL